MNQAEFLLKHHEAATSMLNKKTGRVAVQYRRCVSTAPLTMDNRAFGLRIDGTEVELYPWKVPEWLRADAFCEELCVMAERET